MVIRDAPNYPGLHIIESSREPMKDEINKKIFGVQLQPLEAALKTNKNAVVRKIELFDSYKTNMTNKLFTKKVFDIIKPIYGNSYDVNLLDWLRAEIRILHKNIVWEQQTNSFWCPALIAYIYVKLELLPPTLPWTLISPDEWSKNNTLSFKNCSLSNIQTLR